tara:strand:- start:530 stop:757 length:228 start_codon:yes stop_codon:yes gene_type:complete
MNHFLFLVEKDDHLMGYDIYDTKKKIRNFTIDSGVYLAFSDDSLYNKKKEGDLINFLYKSKVLLVRKKLALERRL